MARSPRSGAPTRTRNPGPARPAAVRAGSSSGAVAARADADLPKKRTNLLQFAREVRAEAKKITWTTWKETWITSTMVLIMVALSALFFFVIDTVLSYGVSNLLTLPARL